MMDVWVPTLSFEKYTLLCDGSLHGVGCLISTACSSWKICGVYATQTWWPKWPPLAPKFVCIYISKISFTMSNDFFMLFKHQEKLQSLYSLDQVQQLPLHIQPLQSQVKCEWHSEERVPPQGWTVYVMYPTDRPELHPDINQNLICLFLPPPQLKHQVSS